MLIRWQKTITTKQGPVVPGAVLTIRRESDQALVTVYRDRDGTNPYPTGTVTADENGYAYFYAMADLYRITSLKPAIDWRDEGLNTAVIDFAGQTYVTVADMEADDSQPIGTLGRVSTGPGAGDYVMTATGWEWSNVQVANSSDVRAAQATADSAIGLARTAPWVCLYQKRGDRGEETIVDLEGAVIGGDEVMRALASSAQASEKLMVRKSNATQMSLFFKGSPGSNWIETVLERVTVPYSGASLRTNADLWRLINTYEVDGGFVRLYEGNVIVNNGEMECAIGVQGAPDHVGGYHGFERQSLYYMLVDGVSVDIDTWLGTKLVRSVDFVQASEIFRHGTESDVLFKHMKHYAFGPTGFLLDQRLECMQDVQITSAYLGMLPIKRRAIDDTTGPLITEYARRSPILADIDPASPIAPFAIEDVSVLGAPMYETTDTESVTIWGETSGISVTMDFLDVTRTDTAQLRIETNRPQYNKIYNALAMSAQVLAGTVWHARIRYTFNTIK